MDKRSLPMVQKQNLFLELKLTYSKLLELNFVHSARLAQRNLPTKHESEKKGLNSKKVLERRVEVF